METRRNRLRLAAFRRGLLKPDYPNGLQSRIRENWILDLMEREIETEGHMNRMTMRETVLAPHLDRKKVFDHISRINDQLNWLKDFKLGSLKPFLTAEAKLLQSSGGLINVWQNMAKDGTLASIQERMRKLYEAYTQQQEDSS